MNKIIKKILVGDTLMPVINLRQPGFIYSTCGPLTKNIKIINHKNSKLSFLIKRLQVELLKMKSFKTSNYWKNYTKQLLKKLKNEKYTHLL